MIVRSVTLRCGLKKKMDTVTNLNPKTKFLLKLESYSAVSNWGGQC